MMVVCLEEALACCNMLMLTVASQVAQSKDYPEELNGMSTPQLNLRSNVVRRESCTVLSHMC